MAQKDFAADVHMHGNRIKQARYDKYVHDQQVPSNLWTIHHNLGYKPGGIVVKDSTDAPWQGEVNYLDNDNLTISFGSISFAGKAYIS